MNKHFKAENTAQAEALGLISAKTHSNVLGLIEIYGAEFRAIIKDFELEHGKAPTAQDLIWIASEHAGRDITETEEVR